MRHTLTVATLCLLASASVGLAQEAGQERPKGGMPLDVVVTDKTGTPVKGLQMQNFKLLDDGREREVATFGAYDGVRAKADPPVQMILVIDCVNTGLVELGYVRQGLTKFLRQNEGRLAQPTAIVRFTVSGVQFLSPPSTNGNELAGVVDRVPTSIKPMGLDNLSLSMNALSTIVNKEAKEPGRKMLIWLGPGWPTPMLGQHTFTKVDEREQQDDFHLVVQLAKAMEEARIALYGGYEGASFFMRDYLKPVRKVSETDPRDLALDVLAVKSGGHGELPGINRDSAVTEVLNDFVAEASTFYSITFDPPKTHKADQFHEIKVKVDRPGLTVRTIAGYYDDPEHFRPMPKKEKRIYVQRSAVEEPVVLRLVTVSQLTQVVEKVKSERDNDAAREIEKLQLTERLSSQKLAAFRAELTGAKSQAALMAVADESAFLSPPAIEVPSMATPDIADQTHMMSLVVDYLKTTIPKLPNFYAKRLTTSFEQVWTPKDNKGTHNPSPMQLAGQFKATVYYRRGKEVVHAEGAQEHGLTTLGTFGPILNTVIVDAARSNSTQWSRWEEGPNGPMAVFRWQVPQANSHYQVSGSGELGTIGPSAYHGEIGVDPHSGAILRLALEADPSLGSPMKRADIMVEYGSVDIGGKTYTCPLRSVAYSVGTSNTLEAALGMGFDQEAARINDVVFNDYHVFRSEMRIVP